MRTVTPPPAPPAWQRLTYTSSQRFQYTIATRQGDLVTIQGDRTAAAGLAATATSFTGRLLAAQGTLVTVTGELNQEELAAVTGLVQDLEEVGRRFYGDDPAAAVAAALALPDYAPLASFTATFTATTTGRLQEYHPLPSSLPAEPLMAGDTVPALAGRWQQIEELLAAMAAPAAPAAPATLPAADLPAAIAQRLTQTLAAQPVLAPFLPALTSTALDRLATVLPPAVRPAAADLHQRLASGVEHWLLT